MYRVIPLGELLNQEYNQTKIEEAFKKFSCQLETDLENFLAEKAIIYDKAGIGKTYLLIDSEELNKNQNFTVMAYFTISHKSVDISALSKSKKRKMMGAYPGRDGLQSISAFLIGQLGRNDTYTHEQLSGETILNECYNAISIAAKIVGGNLIVLECRECMYSKFYEKYGFKKLNPELSAENLYTLYQKVDFGEYWKNK